MSSRRDFLNLAIKGSVLTAAAAAMTEAAAATRVATSQANKADQPSARTNSRQGHYRPPHKFGLGGVPLGNEFSVVTDEDANAILEAAWSAGVRYYDMAPWYGLGLAERRFGYFLHNKQRSDYVLSSKVGKLLKASQGAKRDLFPFSPRPMTWCSTTRPQESGVRLRTACRDWASTGWTSSSSTTSRPTTSCCRPLGRSSSRLRPPGHSLS